jgi:hypothetical protein
MNPKVAEKPTASKTNIKASRTFKPITLVKADDGQLEVPKRIEVVRAGNWPNSVKGNLTISSADLDEMKANFDAGMSQPYPGFGLPIDFGHADFAEAAGWIKDLEVVGNVLYADVEWSTAGEEALRGGLYKCFSPAFYPACMGEYHDPENFDVTARNVLEGGGLTNIPFFKGLTPIQASTSSNGDEDKNVIYINASKEEEKNSMDLAEIRAKENDALTEDERKFLDEHKSELSAEEVQKFGFEAPKSEEGEEQEEEQEEEAPAGEAEEVELPEAVAASLKAANVVMVKADRLKSLEETAEKFEKKEAQETVQAHVQRGAIKADQLGLWTNKLVAARGKDREEMETLLSNLPDNKVMADEIGQEEGESVENSAQAELMRRAGEAVKASVKDGKATVALGEAVKTVLASDKGLSDRVKEEREAAESK